MINSKELWDALREVACTTKLQAVRIVQLNFEDVEKAVEQLNKKEKEKDKLDSQLHLH